MLKKIKANVRPTMSDRTSVGFRSLLHLVSDHPAGANWFDESRASRPGLTLRVGCPLVRYSGLAATYLAANPHALSESHRVIAGRRDGLTRSDAALSAPGSWLPLLGAQVPECGTRSQSSSVVLDGRNRPLQPHGDHAQILAPLKKLLQQSLFVGRPGSRNNGSHTANCSICGLAFEVGTLRRLSHPFLLQNDIANGAKVS